MSDVEDIQKKIDTLVDAVLFACDGVVVDSEGYASRALQESLAAQGVHLTDEEVRARFLGLSMATIVERCKEQGVALPREFRDDVEQRYMGLARGNLRVMPGAMMLIGSLTARMLVGMVTSGSLKRTHFSLAQVGFAGAFPVIVTADEVPRSKPHPDGIELACKRLRVEAKHALVVDDSPAGIEAGLAANCYVIGYASSLPREALTAAGAHHVIDSLQELRILLRKKGRTT